MGAILFGAWVVYLAATGQFGAALVIGFVAFFLIARRSPLHRMTGWYSNYRSRNALTWRQVVWGVVLIFALWTIPSTFLAYGRTVGFIYAAAATTAIRLLRVWAKAWPETREQKQR